MENGNQKEFKGLLESIRFVFGYDFTDYAESTVKRRISHFMRCGIYPAPSEWALEDQKALEPGQKSLNLIAAQRVFELKYNPWLEFLEIA